MAMRMSSTSGHGIAPFFPLCPNHTRNSGQSPVRARGHFPTDEAAMKLLFLVLNRSEKEWTMPAREWSLAKAQFAILFGERFTRAMA